MKLKDIIDIPLRNLNIYFSSWVIIVFISIVPGTLLWLVTLGGFRYFNIMSKLCKYLVDKDFAENHRSYYD